MAFVLILVFLAVLWLSRSYLLSFFLFGLTGIAALSGEGFLQNICRFFNSYLFEQMADPIKVSAVILIPFYCGYVGLMEYGGPIKGFAGWFTRWADTPLKTQAAAYFSSTAVFFSDLGSPGITGSLFQEKYNASGVPREKLAVLLNFTAAPVCSLVPLVGWGIVAVAVIYGSLQNAEAEPLSLFLHAVPYFGFPILLIFTPLLMISRRFCTEELRKTAKYCEKEHKRYLSERKRFVKPIEIAEREGSGVILIVTLAVLLSVLTLCFVKEGESPFCISLDKYLLYLCSGLLCAGILGIVLSGIAKRALMDHFSLYTSMFKRTLSVTAIMVMAWFFCSIAADTGVLTAAAEIFLAVPPVLAAPLLLIAGMCLSVRTASAWATYAVLIPIALYLGQDAGYNLPMLIGAAVSGGIYGDISAGNSHSLHYAAESAGVDPKELARMQKPYLLAAAVSCAVASAVSFCMETAWLYLLVLAVVYICVLLFICSSAGKINFGGKK